METLFDNSELEIQRLEHDLSGLLDRLENPREIAELVTFNNSHEIAYHLYHMDNSAALALFKELQYWILK